MAGLAVAFFGAADALTGSGTSGSWTFVALMGCLAFLGLAVVPLGAFSALRNERMEQTLELITLTALSPRRVVIGKLLAQGVKLATLFAGDGAVHRDELPAGRHRLRHDSGLAAGPVHVVAVGVRGLPVSVLTVHESRAMSGAVLGGVAIVMFLFLFVFGLPRVIFLC